MRSTRSNSKNEAGPQPVTLEIVNVEPLAPATHDGKTDKSEEEKVSPRPPPVPEETFKGKDIESGINNREDKDEVKIFETCADVRRHIDAWLHKAEVTQAQFLRDLRSQYHAESAPKGISASQLQAFRGKKGPNAGNTSSVFYAAYCCFEKRRIKDGKNKTEHRKKMEEIWGPKGGFDTKIPSNRGITCFVNERPTFDKYGQLEIIPAH